MKIKLLHFIHGLNTGGAETLVKEYLTKIDTTKFDATLLLLNRLNTPYEKIIEKSRIKVIYVDDYLFKRRSFFYRIINYYLRYVVVRKIIRTINPDIIHYHLILSEFVKFSNPKKNTKIFLTVHSEPQAYWGKGKYHKDFLAAKYLVKRYGMCFIALHDKMRLEINNLFGVDNTIVLNNGIDFTRFENVKDKSIIRSELKIPQESFVIGHVGRFSDVKNHNFIVNIFENIVQKKKNAFLLLVGNGELKEKIKNQLLLAGLGNKFLILSDRTDIPDLLNAMDIFVFPSKFEGLGISLIEAQKMKLPCVVSDTVPEFAQVSNLIKWHSLSEPVDVWAESLCNFSVDKIEWQGIENLNMNQIVKQLESIYEQS